MKYTVAPTLDESLNIPMSYMPGGRWLFTGSFGDDTYSLEVQPHLYRYKLVLSGNEVVEGSVPGLLRKLDWVQSHPQISKWLLSALAWEYRDNCFKDWEKTESFTIDDNEYSITFNIRTGSISFHIPERQHIGSNNDLFEMFPELKVAHHGMLSRFLAKIFKDGKDIPDNWDGMEDKSSDMINYYIHGWKIGVSYSSKTQIICLTLSERTVHSHVEMMNSDLLELEVLHGGRFKVAVLDILECNGFTLG